MTAVAPAERKTAKLSRYRWGLAFLIVLAASIGLFVKYARERLAELPALRTVSIERRDLRIAIATTGTVEPDQVVEIGSLVAGRIIGFGDQSQASTKPIEIGTRVAKDAVLVRLDRQVYEVELSKAKAAQRLAEAEVHRLLTQRQQASRDLERAKRLRSTNAESEFDRVATAYEMSEAEHAIALARRDQAMADVRQAEINLANTVIRSPIDGIVIDRRANLGQNVSAATSGLFLLARDLDHMRVRASVSETDIGKIHVGQPASFTVDAHRDKVLDGQVEKILLNARVQGNFVTYDVIIKLDEATDSLLPHMTADVEFETIKRENAWLVPSESLQWWPADEQVAGSIPKIAPVEGAAEIPAPAEGDTVRIWIPTGDGRVRELAVRVGIDDGVHTEVIGDGLQENMPVVVGVIRETTLARIIPSVKTLR